MLVSIFDAGRLWLDDALVGRSVRLSGLSRDDLNGKVGVIQSLDRARGRYAVLTGGSASR